MLPFYWSGSTVSKLKLLWGGSLLFTTQFSTIPDTHFIDLERMKGWVHPGATQWFLSRDLSGRTQNPVKWNVAELNLKQFLQVLKQHQLTKTETVQLFWVIWLLPSLSWIFSFTVLKLSCSILSDNEIDTCSAFIY